EAIQANFKNGFSYNVILCFLEKYHRCVALLTLKRRLSECNLKRNKAEVDLSDVERLIRNELDGPGSIFGYIRMWHTLHVKYGLYVPRVKVASLLRELDPAGVEQRKRHKLKRRNGKVLRLYVDRTNNDPKVMAKYFVDCVEEVGGCPSLLRTDCGTENVVIAGVQSFLRAECDDD
ncbi:unnamed protein product, partial [Pocillopora meandrina]